MEGVRVATVVDLRSLSKTSLFRLSASFILEDYTFSSICRLNLSENSGQIRTCRMVQNVFTELILSSIKMEDKITICFLGAFFIKASPDLFGTAPHSTH